MFPPIYNRNSWLDEAGSLTPLFSTSCDISNHCFPEGGQVSPGQECNSMIFVWSVPWCVPM